MRPKQRTAIVVLIQKMLERPIIIKPSSYSDLKLLIQTNTYSTWPGVMSFAAKYTSHDIYVRVPKTSMQKNPNGMPTW
jgi:Na+/H+ antiporter NhaC